jgi:hypothetical protein
VLSALRVRLTYANVMATVAVFVALGGSSYAAIALNKNSVKSTHIAKGQVKGSDIGRNAVTSAKVKDLSLLAADFRPGQLPAGPKGDTGAQGQKGDTGATGQPGSPGLSGLQRVYVSGPSTDSNSPKNTVATCPAGKSAIGGGYDIVGAKAPDASPNGLANVVADVVLPTTGPPGSVYVEAWEEEATALTWGVDAIAICANVAP